MRRIAICVLLVAFLAVFCWEVAKKERHLSSGTVVIVEIAPVDPRSIMQGDYMQLDFSLSDDISRDLRVQVYELSKEGEGRRGFLNWPTEGSAVIELDENKVAEFVRLDDGTPLGKGELILRYKRKFGEAQIASGAFFFQEGFAELYEKAVYAELRLDEDGNPLIAHLLDKHFKRIVIPKLRKDPDAYTDDYRDD